MSNYAMSLSEAMRFPISAAIALWPALARRCGYEYNAPDYVAREVIAARARMREYLDQRFYLEETSS